MSTNKNIGVPAQLKPFRLWPGVIIVIVQWLLRFVIPALVPSAIAIGLFGGIICGLGILIWWIFFSRASRFERWTAPVLIIVALVVASKFIDKSIGTSMMGLMFVVYSVPVMSLAFVLWAVVSRNLSHNYRGATMIATILVASGFWILLRSDGMDAEAHHFFAWRWAQTSEERLLANADNKAIITPMDSATLSAETEWLGFRGTNRDGVVHGVRIGTNWNQSPPVEIWRRPVGPGCSSFAIHGKLLYTQEQRGKLEIVSCYNLNTGEPVWMHGDTTRFWDSHAGAGPRSTPTISNGRIYTLGATGILNVLDALNGKVIWSRNAAGDTDVKIPGWGYTSSPLVVDSVVMVAIAGQLLAYNTVNGHQRWSEPDGGDSYSSPHLFTSNGVSQVLFMNKAGMASFEPHNGKVLWKLPLGGVPIVQPAVLSENELIISEVGETGGKGIGRFAIIKGPEGWKIDERWTSDKLRPYFNDFVIHKGHIYGFEGAALACIDIEKGDLKWRGGRYGGQLILLADQDILLILSEKGELALVSATPDQFKELARIPAIKGKTWNHPVIAGNILAVRNSQEMAVFRLPSDGNSGLGIMKSATPGELRK